MIPSVQVQAVNLGKSYSLGETLVPVLKGVNLDVARGEGLAIMGPSGCGKSTLMHLLGLLDSPTAGQIFFEGQELTWAGDAERASLRSRKIGFVFQQFNLLKRFSALENVLLPTVYRKEDSLSRSLLQKACELLTEVGLSARIHHLAGKLSGGEQQRVALARALINDPDLILADEPTGNLDSRSGGEVLNLLMSLNQKGKTVVVVTHDPNVASVCQRVIRMKDGEIFGG